VLLGEKEVVFTPRKIIGGWISQGGWLKACEDALPQAVGFYSQPLVVMHIHRLLAALRPPFLYHRRVITKTACDIKRGVGVVLFSTSASFL
jgi:hypothetical protein